MDSNSAGLWTITAQILASHAQEFSKVEAHEADDREGSDCLWLSAEDSDLTEGDLIKVSPLSQERWYVAHDLAHKYGGWPTVWDFSGTETQVLDALSTYIASAQRIRRK